MPFASQIDYTDKKADYSDMPINRLRTHNDTTERLSRFLHYIYVYKKIEDPAKRDGDYIYFNLMIFWITCPSVSRK